MKTKKKKAKNGKKRKPNKNSSMERRTNVLNAVGIVPPSKEEIELRLELVQQAKEEEQSNRPPALPVLEPGLQSPSMLDSFFAIFGFRRK